MLAVVLALAASLCIGTADFLGGSQVRRTSLWTVILIGPLGGVVIMAVVVIVRGHALPPAVVLPGLGAGVLLALTLASLYQAMAIGVMSIIVPIVSLSAIVPVIVGLARGERPTALQLAGVVIALGGTVLAARQKSAGKHHQSTSRASVLLAVLSASTAGFVLVLYAKGAETDPYWTVFLTRTTTVVVFALAFAAVRPGLKLTRSTAAPILAIGVLDASGHTLFSVASTLGLLSIISVLTSVYPVFVVILAYIFVHERLSRTQLLGVTAALVGVALMAAG
jgi:drug/metabolite transporter (DMT)-like permease